jgi:cytoskeletal protein RodZ
MEQRLENIDQFFRDELKEFSPEIPDGTWERIALSLPVRSKKNILLFWKIAAGIAFVLATGSIATYIILSEPDINNTSEINNKTTVIPEVNKTKSPIQQEIASVLAPSPTKVKSKEDAQAVVMEMHPDGAILSDDKIVLNEIQNTVITEKENIVENNVSDSDRVQITQSTIGDDAIVAIIDNQPDKNSSNTILAENIANFKAYQEENSKTEWLIGGQAGPQYSYRNITSSYYDAAAITERNNTESGIIAYAGGVNIELQPKGRFSVESGIYYSKIGSEQVAKRNTQKTILENNSTPPDSWGNEFVSTSISYRFPNSSVKINTTGNSGSTLKEQPIGADNYQFDNENSALIPTTRYYEYIEIPLIAKYAILDRKIGVHLLGGVSTNLMVNNSGLVDDPDFGPTTIETDDVNNFSFSSTFGLGVSYAITSKINMSLEPQFKYFLSKQTHNSYIDVHPYSIGVFTGVKYLF